MTGVTGPLRNVVKKSEEEGKTRYVGEGCTGVTPVTEPSERAPLGRPGSPCDQAKDPSVTGQSHPSHDPSQSRPSSSVPTERRPDQGKDVFDGSKTGVDLQRCKITSDPLSIDLDPSRKVTASEVAKVATERGLSKTEARELIKAETRRLAIETASGPTVALPAAVDRAGTITPLTYDEARARVQAALARSVALTVDVETSGYPLGHNLYKLRLVQLGDAHEVVVFDAAADASVIAELLAGDFPLHAHSATADLSPLHHAKLLDLEAGWSRMYDTVIPAKLADPASTGADPGLKKLAPALLGIDSAVETADAARLAVWKAAGWLLKPEVDTPPERNGWHQIRHDCTTMVRYAGSDVLDTAAIARMVPSPVPAIGERERLTAHMTARVSARGLALGYGHIQALERRALAGQSVVAQTIRDGYGLDNPGSDQQVAAKLAELDVQLPRTDPSSRHPEGQPSVAEAVLTPLTDGSGPVADLATRVLEYRKHSTALSLFLRPYKALCELGDSRARPTVYTLGTNTGRMSAVRPNIQQLPRAGGFRSMINADPGQLMISADFSGVELRVAAALSGDPELKQIIAEGRDLHAELAVMVFGADPEETAKHGRPWPKKAHRYRVKPGVFGRIYGGGVRAVAAGMKTDHATAQRMIDAMDALLPTYAAWSAWLREQAKSGRMTTFQAYSGRVIHLATSPHKAVNYCVGMTTPVLTADLTHVPASKIQVGDRLVGFDEHPQPADLGGQNKYHHLRTAVVEAVSTVVKPSLRVYSADGKVTECSTDHLWLVRPLKGRKNNRPRVRWVRADELQPGDDLLSLGTWDVADGHTAGYVAGLYDGEGSLHRHAGGRRNNQLMFSQNRGPVMDAFQFGMDELGLTYSYYDRSPNSTSTCDHVVVSGLRNVMRTLGTLQPERFRPRFEQVYEGNAITAGLTEAVQVVAVEPAGKMELASIQTSTRTLVANGYLSHNCVQGTARELLVDALVKWNQTKWRTCTLIPVHDELDVFVPAEDAEEATRVLVQCMQSELNGVKIVAEPSAPSFAWQDSE